MRAVFHSGVPGADEIYTYVTDLIINSVEYCCVLSVYQLMLHGPSTTIFGWPLKLARRVNIGIADGISTAHVQTRRVLNNDAASARELCRKVLWRILNGLYSYGLHSYGLCFNIRNGMPVDMSDGTRLWRLPDC